MRRDKVYSTAMLLWYIQHQCFFNSSALHRAHILGKNIHMSCIHIRAHKHTQKEVDEEECFSKLTGRRLIHPSQPVTPIPSLPLFLLPASLFSIKCQDWPFYNHICDLGSGIQMQSMSIRITRLLIERGEMV